MRSQWHCVPTNAVRDGGGLELPESSTPACRQNPSKSSYVRRPNRTVSNLWMPSAAAFACSLSGTTQSKFPSGAAKYLSAVIQLNITIRRERCIGCPSLTGPGQFREACYRSRLTKILRLRALLGQTADGGSKQRHGATEKSSVSARNTV